ncbi:Uncharacterized protein dnm_019430 [Desulfonema magnum]|uniref:DUF5658 domain-containing protein n=2 Tax=Desulfonema magnum TaxID=45655 RepID=A0A975BIC2_9BACT|nr:Uncharacterized protein dnm_019430 [Desulfonema magnum]
MGIAAYILFAGLDVCFTLKGIQGDVFLEGNPLMKYMMESFGPLKGLLIEKTLVFILALTVAVISYSGIEKDSDWIYYLTLSKMTKNWMKRKKRYTIAFIPLYIVAAAQGIAALSWVKLLFSE